MFLDDSEELQIQPWKGKLGDMLAENHADILHCYEEKPFTKVGNLDSTCTLIAADVLDAKHTSERPYVNAEDHPLLVDAGSLSKF